MELQIQSSSENNNFERVLALIEATSRQIRETDRVLSEKFKETDEKFKETDRVLSEKFKETDRVLSENFKKTEQLVGRLSNRWGEFVEGMVSPAIINMFDKRNIAIDRVFNRVKAHKNGDTMEIDIIGANSDYVTVTEVKSKLLSGDVKDFVKKLGRFKKFFPEYSDKNVVGAVAGITIDDSVINFAVTHGLFVIAQKGESVAIVNSSDFVPKTW